MTRLLLAAGLALVVLLGPARPAVCEGCGGSCFNSSQCSSGCFCQRYDEDSTAGECAGHGGPR